MSWPSTDSRLVLRRPGPEGRCAGNRRETVSRPGIHLEPTKFRQQRIDSSDCAPDFRGGERAGPCSRSRSRFPPQLNTIIVIPGRKSRGKTEKSEDLCWFQDLEILPKVKILGLISGAPGFSLSLKISRG